MIPVKVKNNNGVDEMASQRAKRPWQNILQIVLSIIFLLPIGYAIARMCYCFIHYSNSCGDSFAAFVFGLPVLGVLFIIFLISLISAIKSRK